MGIDFVVKVVASLMKFSLLGNITATSICYNAYRYFTCAHHLNLDELIPDKVITSIIYVDIYLVRLGPVG